MVDFKPFRNLHYNLDKVGKIEDVVTPPYDVITEERQRQYYRQSEYNLIRLILRTDEKGDTPTDKYDKAGRQLKEWIRKGILVEDSEEAFYVYEQRYMVNGKHRIQTGIIGLVGIEPFESGQILPHEQIYNKEFRDRYLLLDRTKACLENIIGLYDDRGGGATRTITKYAKSPKPFLDFTHDDGVRHRLWRMTDAKDVKTLQNVMSKSKVIIADGHHRYTTALKYHQDNPGERFGHIMMLLWGMDDNLMILPTHRMLKTDKTRLKERLPEFEISPWKKGLWELTDELSKHKGEPIFGMYDGEYKIMNLKDKRVLDKIFEEGKSMAWNSLDVNMLHKLVIERLLGKETADAVSAGVLKYIKNPESGVEAVDSGEYDAVFIVNPTSIEEVQEIVDAGERMPQKSTYFYPKPLSGITMCRL